MEATHLPLKQIQSLCSISSSLFYLVYQERRLIPDHYKMTASFKSNNSKTTKKFTPNISIRESANESTLRYILILVTWTGIETAREEGESWRCEVYSKKSHEHSGGFHFYMGIRIGIFVIAMAMAGSDSTSLWSRLMCGAAILLSSEKLNLAQHIEACLKWTKTCERWRWDFWGLCGQWNCWKKLQPSEASLSPGISAIREILC